MITEVVEIRQNNQDPVTKTEYGSNYIITVHVYVCVTKLLSFKLQADNLEGLHFFNVKLSTNLTCKTDFVRLARKCQK